MVLLVILALCFLFAGAAMGIGGFLRARDLQARLDRLEQDLNAFRAEVRAAPSDGAASERGVQGPWGTAESDEQAADEQEPPKETATADSGQAIPEPVGGKAPQMPPAVPGRPRASLEERIGTRWAVWVGGLALVLGGVFLVRYSIEAGLMTPAARVISGALLAIALVGGGEWLRRKHMPGETGGPAYIPGVLTLAGTTTAFATVFVAHALYGLVGPGLAFLLLAAVALLTLAASVLHGPAVASYGLLASYVIPFLVSSDQPALWPLAIYGLFVSLAAYGVARLRLWRWLALAAAGGAFFWGHVLAYASSGPWDAGALAFYNLAIFAMAAFVFVTSLYPRDPGAGADRQDWPAALVLFLHALLAYYLLQVGEFGTLSVAVLAIIAVTLMVVASEWPVVASAAVGGSALMILGYLSWEVPLSPTDLAPFVSARDRVSLAFSNPSAEAFPTVGVAFALLSGGIGLWGTLRSTGRPALAAAGVATPLALLGIAYFRVAPFETSMFFGALALVLAAAFLAALAFLDRRLPDGASGREAALAAYTVGTVGAIAMGMSILLQDGWLPVGLALLAAGTVWVRQKWPLPALSWVALGVAVLTCLVIAYDPTIVGADRLGRTPVFNALLYGYGVPTLAFAYCAWQLRDARGVPQQAFEALAMFSALVTLAVLIHHAMNGGAFYAPADTLGEWSLHTLVLLSGSLAAQRLDGISGSPVLAKGSLAFGVLGFLSAAGLHLFSLNPLFSGEPVGGGILFNLLFVAYLLPAVLLAAIARWAGPSRPDWYRQLAGWLAGAMMFAWISLEVRAFFHRPNLDVFATSAAELYTYSAAWLLFGLALLVVGFRWQSRMIRLASGIFVLAAVAKVFLFDMAGLDGAWRALSFIGLGAVLIGIGLIYQRLLMRQGPAAEEKPQAV